MGKLSLKLKLLFNKQEVCMGESWGRGEWYLCHWMCWMASHFYSSTDYNGVFFSSTFNEVTRIGSHFFRTLRVRKLFDQKWLRWGLEVATKSARNSD